MKRGLMLLRPSFQATSFGAILSALVLVGTPCAAGTFAFVTNQNSSDLSVLDLDKRTELKRIDVPGKPAGIHVSPLLDSFYTVSPDNMTVRRFSLSSCKVQAEAVMPGGPTGVVLAQTTGQLFVSDWYNSRVFVLDAETLNWVGELETGAAPAGLAVAGDDEFLVSADRDADQVSVFSLPDLKLLHRIDVGTRPFGVAAGPDGFVHVANVGSDDVYVVDPARGVVIAIIAVGARPYGIGFAAGQAFTTDQYADTVTVYTLSDYRKIDTVDVGEYPEGIAGDPDGKMVVSTNWFSNSISLIDPISHDVLAEVPTGDGPRAFGQFLYSTVGDVQPCHVQ